MIEHFCGDMHWSIGLLGFDAMWSYWWKCWYVLKHWSSGFWCHVVLLVEMLVSTH